MVLQDLSLSLFLIDQTVGKQLHEPARLLSCLCLPSPHNLTSFVHLVGAVPVNDSDLGSLCSWCFVHSWSEGWLGCCSDLLNLFISSFDEGFVSIFEVKGGERCLFILAKAFLDGF